MFGAKKIWSKMFTVRLNTVTNWKVKYTHTYTLHYFLPQSWWNALLFKKHIASVHFRLIFSLIFVCHFWNLPSFYGLTVFFWRRTLIAGASHLSFSSVLFFFLLQSLFLLVSNARGDLGNPSKMLVTDSLNRGALQTRPWMFALKIAKTSKPWKRSGSSGVFLPFSKVSPLFVR